ncbi:MAG: carboxypeptidase regulatory-like domain-containing protein [Gemmatimonadota bacterium]
MMDWKSRVSVAAGVFALAAAPVCAQTGVIEGMVHDSLDGGPLTDAAVFLWETNYRAETDDAGRFRIGNVPPGDYSILFFHRRLGEMGLSAGPRAIQVRADQTTSIDLSTPSRATLTQTDCLLDGAAPGGGMVAGHIMDAGSEMSLAGAEVSISWHPEGQAVPNRINAASGPDGWFHVCDAPKGVPLLLSADFYGRQGPRREITIDDSGYADASVTLRELRPSRLSGRLIDRETGNAVEGAETWIRGTFHRTLTDSRGNFVFEQIPAGTYMLMTDHLAYGTKMDTLTVPDGQRLLVEMILDTRPIEIAPLTVTAEAPPVEMARRRGGIVITRDEIDEVRQRSRDASDIIRSLHIPGVLVRHSSNGTICVGYITGQVKMNQTGCVEMMIYINDVRATDADFALRLPPDAIERMVLYKPVEAGNLFGLGGGNGVWMIYTRGN